MTIAVRPIYQALGTNNPNKQISVTRWNDGSALTGAAGASILFDQDGAAFDVEFSVNVFTYMSPAERASVIARDEELNVTDAFTAASARLQALGGGHLIVPPGTYVVGKQTFGGTTLDGVTQIAYGPQEIITVTDAGTVHVSGYGAILKLDPSIRYGSFDPVTGERYDPVLPFYDAAYYAYPYRGMINVERCERVCIEGIELDGNNENIILGGHWGDSQWQLEGHGIVLSANNQVFVRDVNSHHQPGDGVVLSVPGMALNAAPEPATLVNLKARYNGRQGVSLVGGRNVIFVNCDLSYTGRAFNGAEQMLTYPAAGIDIEAEGAIIRDILFVNPYMMNNVASGINAQSGNSGRVKVIGGLIDGLLVSRFDYSFEGVTFLGQTQIGIPTINEYKASSTAVTLTVAGVGPYTVTRDTGSFITDGHEAGGTIQLSGALDAANTGKDLQILSLTATELTVQAVDGSTLTAEGPIAACTVSTVTTAEDGQFFDRCTFLYDASLTENGEISHPAQSQWNAARFGYFRNCTIDTGDQMLPIGNYTLAHHSPVFENCNWRSNSTDVGGVARHGQYRGVNRFTVNEDSPLFLSVGVNSRIDYGAIYVNGVAV